MLISRMAVAGVAEEGLPADFGKYRLTKRIATGGMAEIFLAHRQDAPMEPMVIKRILPHLVKSGEFVSMFLDEARIAAQLTHENVVRIEDVGQISGAYYIAMEYVHGEDIRRIYNRAYKLQRSLPLSHSIRVIADAAMGLGYAHKLTDVAGKPMGVVHRDVSPQNILVTYEGAVKVVDFGIAKAANKVAQTRAGVLKGKYSYMSPEQALGDPIDHRTDIFALGIILYETTTGTRLFKRHNELATLQAIIKCEFVPPSEALPGYPPQLEGVLLKALAKRPEDRYSDAEELHDALYEFLKGSGLFVERTAIAEFMRSLFEDRLELEEGTGEPALPQEDEVRAEMADKTTPMRSSEIRVSDAFDRSESATQAMADDVLEEYIEGEQESLTDGSNSEALPGFADGPDLDLAMTSPDKDHEDLGLDLDRSDSLMRPEVASIHQAHPNKGTSPRAQTRSNREPSEPAAVAIDPAEATRTTADDTAPTIAVQKAYRAPTPAPLPRDQIPPEASVITGRTKHEHTEQVRARGPAPRTEHERPLPKPNTLLPIAIGIGAVVIAVLTGVIVSRLLQPDAPKQPVAPIPKVRSGQLTILTEPNASVFINGERLGAANEEGRAGPFEIRAGGALLRVSSPKIGFERQREISIESGQRYEVEVQARQGWLRLAIAPWARVRIDGKEIGLTPLPKIPLYEGVHSVELVNPDINRRHRSTVRILPGKQADLKLDLRSVGERM